LHPRDDVERAIKNLQCLGSGFNLLHAGSCRMVQSVPLELSTDHTLLITFAQDTKCVSVSQIRESLGWPESRTMAALVRTGASSRNVYRWLIHLCRMSFCKKASCGWTIKA